MRLGLVFLLATLRGALLAQHNGDGLGGLLDGLAAAAGFQRACFEFAHYLVVWHIILVVA